MNIIELAKEAGVFTGDPFGVTITPELERFAALVREDEREKQQEPLYFGLTPDHTWLSTTEAEYNKLKEKYRMKVYTTPPTAALAARQMRDAAVKVCREKAKDWKGVDWANAKHAAIALEKTIAALPVQDVQWRDLTDEEIDMLIDVEEYIRTVANQISVSNKLKAVIAKFKEKQL